MAPRKRPKRIKVPESEDEWLTQPTPTPDIGIIRCSVEDLAHRVPRPLPATAILSALAQSSAATASEGRTRRRIPLLDRILPQGTSDHDGGGDDEDDEKEQGPLDAIDDPKNSTLTRGQHNRYHKLLQLKSSSTLLPLQKREFYKIRQLVRSEQVKYKEALTEFFRTYSQRFLSGFRGPNTSEYASYHARHVQTYREQYHKASLATQFGKLRQTVSLQKTHAGEGTFLPREIFSTENAQDNASSSLPTKSIDLTTSVSSSNRLPPCPKDIAPPKFLWQDETAVALAHEHSVTLVTTDTTLETLLTQQHESWSIPLWWKDDVQLLDLPLPQPCLPRDCLSRGIEHAFRASAQQAPTETFRYLVLTVRHNHHLHQRLLVRTEANPSVRVHLEYFVERGWERVSSEERALWILDSLLGKTNQPHMARVDLDRVHKWESVGLAHALAQDDQDDHSSVQLNFRRMMVLLRAVQSMPVDGHHLLRFENYTVGVHLQDTQSTEIDVTGALDRADGVLLGQTALLKCAREWEWVHDRIENTFPISQ